MPTIAAGNSEEFYVPVDSTVTFTQAAGFSRVGVGVRTGAATVAPFEVRGTVSKEIPGGSTVFVESVGGALQYSVSGDGGSAVGIAWGGHATAVTAGAGALQWFTIGAATFQMRSDGAFWRMLAPTDFFMDTVSAPGATGTSEQTLKASIAIPAGFLQGLRYLSIKALFSKSGVTDSGTTRFRIGTTGTASDTSVYSGVGLSTSSRSVAIETLLLVASSTQLRLLAGQSASNAWSGAGLANGYPSNITIPDASANGLIVSASVTMSGSTDTPNVPHLIISGY